MSPDATQEEIARSHPCFDAQAHARVGRVHLPVAPRCNIRCAFCERRVCASIAMQHPGWARRLMSPAEAADLVRRLVRSRPEARFVVGVAGPGDPLENEETFDALGRVHREHPALTVCVSTNGLLLSQRLSRLLDAGVRAATVTVNAPDADVGQQIYDWVRFEGKVYRGREGAEVLIARQREGIRAALDAGVALKVNTVLVPGVNDGGHVVRLAHGLKALGIRLMNLMPLIPSGRMKGLRPPTREELQRAQSDCEAAVPQFRLCMQCRADAVHFPGLHPPDPEAQLAVIP